jgi:hypothetical protein
MRSILALSVVVVLLAASSCDLPPGSVPTVEPRVPTADGPLTCGEVRQRVDAAMASALLASNACTRDDDCTHIWASTDCWGTCGAAVNRDKAASYEAAIADISRRYCGQIAPVCGYASPACAVPGPFTCKAGRCAAW